MFRNSQKVLISEQGKSISAIAELVRADRFLGYGIASEIIELMTEMLFRHVGKLVLNKENVNVLKQIIATTTLKICFL